MGLAINDGGFVEVCVDHRPATLVLSHRVPRWPRLLPGSFGHWECDLVMFSSVHGQRNVISMVERQTRFAIFRAQPSRPSKSIVAGLGEVLDCLI